VAIEETVSGHKGGFIFGSLVYGYGMEDGENGVRLQQDFAI